jgi:hypothetical protein
MDVHDLVSVERDPDGGQDRAHLPKRRDPDIRDREAQHGDVWPTRSHPGAEQRPVGAQRRAFALLGEVDEAGNPGVKQRIEFCRGLLLESGSRIFAREQSPRDSPVGIDSVGVRAGALGAL